MKIIGRKIVASIYLGQEILSMPAGKCCVVRILDYQNLSHYDYILAARAGAGEQPPPSPGSAIKTSGHQETGN